MMVRSKIMFVLLRVVRQLPREADEDMKECRLTLHHWCRLTLMPEDGPSLFKDRLEARNYPKLPEFSWPTQNPIYVCF